MAELREHVIELALKGSPPPVDELSVVSFQGEESLGRLFRYQLELASPNEAINIDDILGENVTVEVSLGGGEHRYFNGIVSSFAQTGHIDPERQQGQRGATYQATLRPWLWLLTRTADSRIFQKKSVPDIFKDILGEAGFSGDIDDQLTEEHKAWDYCVQYRETDFNFVSRLMEEEGIYYYFRHEDGKHTLVLADSSSAHEAIRGDDIPYFHGEGGGHAEEGSISSWMVRREVQPGAYALNDFDFRRPKASLRVQAQGSENYAHSNYEVYDYPGEFGDRFEGGSGDQYAELRIQELHVQQEQASGLTDVAVMATGGLFTLESHPRSDQNKEYLVINAAYEIAPRQGGGPPFQCQFTAIDGRTPYRSGRITRKPVVEGPQTAMVVGPSGEEIHTDEYGRIKVQFHWDREGGSDENSSCWIRVAQVWAGSNWGGIHIPRIGQEVVVEFLEGDPDRPIVTGCVYNADQMPPYGLPDSKTQSGIKSHSSKGGSGDNYNEIRFEDAIGEEEFHLQAEKDLTIVVKNDESREVRNNRTMEVKSNDTITISGDRKEDITGKETRTVTGAVDETFNSGETKTITGDKVLTLTGNRNSTITGNQTLTQTGNRTNTITGNHMETITGTSTETITATLTQTIVGGATVVTPATYTLIASGGFNLVAPASDTIFKGTDFAVVGFKAEAVGSANGVTGMKIEACPVAHTVKGYDGETKVTKIDTAVTKIKSGAIDLATKALHILS